MNLLEAFRLVRQTREEVEEIAKEMQKKQEAEHPRFAPVGLPGPADAVVDAAAHLTEAESYLDLALTMIDADDLMEACDAE